MISFRHHVVSLVAVFLALAAGVALGGGPLSDVGRDAAPATEDPAAAAEVSRAQQRADFAEEVVSSGASRFYADGLTGRPVALLIFPGVPDATVEAVTDQVALAGGTLAGRYAAQPALVDVGEKSLVDTLGSQLMTQLESASVTTDAPTYERLGELLGLAITTTDAEGSAAPGPEASAVSQALEGAALVSLATEEPVRAPYLLVLLGPDTEAADDPIYTGLLTGLARRAVGVVVAADASDGDAGRLARLRDDPVTGSVATVDGIEAAPGQVTALLALAAWPQTKGGAFGASGADGAVTLR